MRLLRVGNNPAGAAAFKANMRKAAADSVLETGLQGGDGAIKIYRQNAKSGNGE